MENSIWSELILLILIVTAAEITFGRVLQDQGRKNMYSILLFKVVSETSMVKRQY